MGGLRTDDGGGEHAEEEDREGHSDILGDPADEETSQLRG